MNILIASTRGLNPLSEWSLMGTRYLLEKTLQGPFSFVLLDQNPDLLAFDGIHMSHRRILQSNHFQHETLLPFSSVVIEGSREGWGGTSERLWGLLSKTEVPLYALGMNVPSQKLSSEEDICLKRASTFLSVKNTHSQEFFDSKGFKTHLLPDPICFAGKHSPIAPLRIKDPKFGFYLHFSPEISERSFIRPLLKEIHKISQHHSVVLFPGTANDFMRISTMFGGAVQYSYEAASYIHEFMECDCIISQESSVAFLANSLGRQALLLKSYSTEPIDFLSHVPKLPISDLYSQLNKPSSQNSSFLSQWQKRNEELWMDALGVTALKMVS